MRQHPDDHERRILLLSLRARHDEAARAELARAAVEGTDWARLLEVAEHLRAVLYLREGLRCAGAWEAASQEARCRMDAALVDGQSLTLVARQVLGRVVEALEGTRVLALRGPVLGEVLFGPQLPRPFTDLDLLIAADDWEAMWRGVEPLAQGTPLRMKWLLAPGHREFVILDSAHLGLDAARELSRCAMLASLDFDVPPGITVELKPSLSRGYAPRPDLEEAWGRRVETEWLGLRLALPPWELTLVHLADHAAEHATPATNLLTLADLDALVRQRPMDWGLATMRARELGLARQLAVMLSAAQRALGTPLPDGVLSQLAVGDGVAAQVLQRIERGDVLGDEWGPLTAEGPLRVVLRDPARAMRLGPVQQMRRLARAAVPSRCYMRWQYGARGLGGVVGAYLCHWARFPRRLAGRRWL
jgi:hypothetical protein